MVMGTTTGVQTGAKKEGAESRANSETMTEEFKATQEKSTMDKQERETMELAAKIENETKVQ
jgi:hypothetical protein